jgi:transposase, IS5 family
LLKRTKTAFDQLPGLDLDDPVTRKKVGELSKYLDYADHHLDLIDRRIIQGETIPHHVKIYSIFEYYTQWISKGKAKAPVELGLRVAVMDDQHDFILHS